MSIFDFTIHALGNLNLHQITLTITVAAIYVAVAIFFYFRGLNDGATAERKKVLAMINQDHIARKESDHV